MLIFAIVSTALTSINLFTENVWENIGLLPTVEGTDILAFEDRCSSTSDAQYKLLHSIKHLCASNLYFYPLFLDPFPLRLFSLSVLY